jgi:hypothetical protein
MCKDGTFYSGSSKSGACSGHHGIQTWYGAQSAKMNPPAAAPAAPAAPAAAAPAPAGKAASTGAPAPGGGPGMVWANSSSKVYHCPTDKYYGKTKSGAYMSEADAKAKGYHADHGKACS